MLSCSDWKSAEALSRALHGRTIIASNAPVKVYQDGTFDGGDWRSFQASHDPVTKEVVVKKTDIANPNPPTASTNKAVFVQLGQKSYGFLHLDVQQGGKRVNFILKNYVFNPYQDIDLKSFAKLVDDKPTVPQGKNVMYMDFDIPKDLNDAVKNNPAMFPDVSIKYDMFDEGYDFFKAQKNKELDGIYGEWIRSNAYAQYGGESVNLTKFRNALKTMSREEAAFETVTGCWAKSKGFTKVKFFDDPLEFTDNLNRYNLLLTNQGRVEVIFYR